jgi:hypothetical protein
MFLEEWAAAQGYQGVYSEEITQWRRETMSNLLNAFDFENVRTMPAHYFSLNNQAAGRPVILSLLIPKLTM